MNVIVHYPEDFDIMKELRAKVTEIHTEAVTAYISKLSCPKEQKLQLIKAVKENLEGKART